MTTDKAELISRALRQPVAAWIAERRPLSYRKLVAELYGATGYAVTHETLRSWDPTRER